jgi:rhomboid protease GluP
MAIGFTPTYKQDYSLDGLTNQQFIAAAIEAAGSLGWRITFLGDAFLSAYTGIATRCWNAEVKIEIADGIAHIKSSSTGSEVADMGKNRKTIEGFLKTFGEKKATFSEEELEVKYSYLVENNLLNNDRLRIAAPPNAELAGVLSIFVPKKDYYVTPLLIDANMLLFLIMAISGVSIMLPESASLLQWGANFRPLTMGGEWWRLMTNCFLHIGVMHLLMNMYALFFIGLLLEPYLGKVRFLTAYLVTGIVASVVSLWWHDHVISAGASGAIFGMYGVFLAMLTTNLIKTKERRALLASIVFFVGYNLVEGMKGGIDNAAHLGGLISGLVFGYGYVPTLKKSESGKLKYATLTAIAVALFAVCLAIYKSIPIG